MTEEADNTALERSPAEIQDPYLQREAKKAAIWIGMAALLWLAVILAQPLLVIFGGMVFAAMIDGGARLLGRVLPIGRGWRVGIVLLATVAFLVWTAMFTGDQIAQQAAALPRIVEFQFNRLLVWAQAQGLEVNLSDFQSMAGQVMGGVGQVTKAVGGLVGGLTTMFMIMVLGIFIAIEPRLYERGVAWMVPLDQRSHFEGTLARMGFSMRRLLAGRLLGMVVEGVGTWLLLEWYGVPMAALLGLLTGLLAFLPNIGAPISGALMILVGFSGGADMGIFTIFVYLFVQIVDGYVIVPMVAKKTVDLAPALVLGAQLVFGALFGILGLALADPIVAMIKIALERQSERNTAKAEEAAPQKMVGV